MFYHSQVPVQLTQTVTLSPTTTLQPLLPLPQPLTPLLPWLVLPASPPPTKLEWSWMTAQWNGPLLMALRQGPLLQ